jgi:hypothetical protein
MHSYLRIFPARIGRCPLCKSYLKLKVTFRKLANIIFVPVLFYYFGH